MAVIAQIQDKGRLEALIDKRLDDMCDWLWQREKRAAARQYYLGLVQEDMECSEGMTLNESLDGNELAVIGFVAGYKACLRSHGER